MDPGPLGTLGVGHALRDLAAKLAHARTARS